MSIEDQIRYLILKYNLKTNIKKIHSITLQYNIKDPITIKSHVVNECHLEDKIITFED